MADNGSCPVCSQGGFEDIHELEAHVNAHFGDEAPPVGRAPPPPAASADYSDCPVCGQLVPAADRGSHQLAHALEAEDRAAAAAGDAAAARAAAQELDEQAAAALAAAEWGDDGGSGEGWEEAGLEDAAHRAQLEDLYFEQLRAKYGFSQAARPGCCRICGEAGHWARDCDRNPDVQQARARVVEPLPQLIAASQRPGVPTALPGGAGLLRALAGCLEAAAAGAPAAAEYRAALCGEVQHYGNTLYSAGWGCGYSNMQMLASHLLAARPEARAALFGGAGYVPDIPALQAWLEAAWRAGFDLQGAEQLGGRVQGTHKWVGTTECAALLRSCGLRARIADFGTSAEDKAATAAAAAAAAAPAARGGAAGGSGGGGGAVAVHPNVECDGCGQCPIRGDRYTSESVANYDLCGACHAKPGAAAAGPFRRMLPGAMAVPQPAVARQGRSQHASAGDGGSASVPAKLMDWVWRYFTSGSDGGQGGQPSSRDGGAAAGQAAGSTAAPAAAPAAAGGAALAGPSTSAAAAAAQAAAAAASSAQPGPSGAKRLRLQAAPQRVQLSGKSPLYFQHEGHSRTIVGIERRLVGRERRAEHTLLVLDPGTSAGSLARALAERQGWQRLLKRGAHTLRHGQYQVVWVEPGLAQGAELDRLKLVAASERY